MSTELRLSPLNDTHVNAGARLVDFGGWLMPVQYPTGTVTEHMTCRSAAAMFDVSHLGTVRVNGPGAGETLQHAFTNDLGRIGPGSAQYTHLLDPADGSVTDDIIVWQIADDSFDVMPNASNTDRVVGALSREWGHSVRDVTSERAVIAVQGPEARARLSDADPASGAARVGRFKVTQTSFCGVDVTVAGTGYTGEDGVEMAIPVVQAASVWDRLVAAGVMPAGLGARDTLRLEAGFPLYGHELGPTITPLQANLAWVVNWKKGDFRGREALEAERRGGPHRLLRGLLGKGRRPLREGCEVRADGEPVGVTTSGSYSPVLHRGIALALLSREVSIDDRVTIDLRGRPWPAQIVKPPFHRLGSM